MRWITVNFHDALSMRKWNVYRSNDIQRKAQLHPILNWKNWRTESTAQLTFQYFVFYILIIEAPVACTFTSRACCMNTIIYFVSPPRQDACRQPWHYYTGASCFSVHRPGSCHDTPRKRIRHGQHFHVCLKTCIYVHKLDNAHNKHLKYTK